MFIATKKLRIIKLFNNQIILNLYDEVNYVSYNNENQITFLITHTHTHTYKHIKACTPQSIQQHKIYQKIFYEKE